MPKQPPQFRYVDIHGRPISPTAGRQPAAAGASTASSPAPAGASATVDPADADTVFDAIVLAGSCRGLAPLAAWLKALGWPTRAGAAFGVGGLQPLIQALQADGRVVAVVGPRGVPTPGWRAAPKPAADRRAALLAREDVGSLWIARACALAGMPVRHGAGAVQLPHLLELRDGLEAGALLQLMLVSGMDPASLNQRLANWPMLGQIGTIGTALEELLAAQAVERLDPATWWGLLTPLAMHGRLGRHPTLARWLDEHLDDEQAPIPSALRLVEAERRLDRGDADGMRRQLERLGVDTLGAWFELAWQARQGQWADAAAGFPPLLKRLGDAQGRRRGLLPRSLLRWYPLALLADKSSAAWVLARKFCVAESGRRSPPPDDPWGRWAHVIDVRLGAARLQPKALDAAAVLLSGADPADDAAEALWLAAWLGHTPQDWDAERVQQIADALAGEDRRWQLALLRQACRRLRLPLPTGPDDPLLPAYFEAPRPAWHDALSAIVALDEGRRPAADGLDGLPPPLRWLLSLDEFGRPVRLEAVEPSASGRARPKPVTPRGLAGRTRLDPRDAAVARAVRRNRYRPSEVDLDLCAAVQALVEHPDLRLADAPEQVVNLKEGLPELHVHRQRAADGKAQFAFELEPGLAANRPVTLEHHHLPWGGDRADEESARREALRVLRDAPDRARLVRLGPAQLRVIDLATQDWQVPEEATQELQAALRVLAAHFVVHSDAEAGDPVPSDSRLVAQLEPRGAALQLRLAVRPFGDGGPLVPAGLGRARLLTRRGELSVSTTRELAREQAHLDSVLAELPELGEPPPDAVWLLDDPALALAVVERLGRLVSAGASDGPLRAVEWPRGRSLRVLSVEEGALRTTLRSGRDWFEVNGELALDEGRVLSLQRLLALLRDAGGSRFVALGEGRYLALAEQLRQRLSDLDALAETGPGADAESLRLGATTAGWLADAAPALGLRGDARWRERARRLQEAAELPVVLPSGLRAELRSYQQQGVEWMARLAHAGFGAILADDMGLGKTVQTLALLLLRAAGGPALVVAPTSVCPNWVAEAARFAPSLTVVDHAGELRSIDRPPGPGELRVVSYALLLRDAAALQAVPWHTLVLDEAQALKNADTRRVKTVADLGADFRLALTGTPVENRLSDLWSLMALLNPGLLGSAQRFAERFGQPIERQRDAAARARLRRLVAPFLLRRTKSQVLLDLPPRTEIVRRVEPDAEERALLDALRREALARIAAIDPADGRRAFNVLGELMRLRRAACDPRLAAPDIGRVGAKVQAFEALARELVDGRHQALVFSQFTDFLDLLAERLEAAGLRHLRLDGSTPAAARAERVAAFQRGEAELFLISLKAGGFGLNLTAADYVVIADPWWNPAAEDQAMGRAHRMGQQRPVTVYRLVTAGSVEERIVALHADKRELADGVLAGQDGGRPLPAEDLLALLQDAAGDAEPARD